MVSSFRPKNQRRYCKFLGQKSLKYFCCYFGRFDDTKKTFRNQLTFNVLSYYGADCGLRTPNEAFFHWNSELLGLGREILGYLGIFGQTVSTNFGTVSLLSMFFIIQPYFYKKNLAFISTSQIFIWYLNWDFGHKVLGIWPLCVRSPWCWPFHH